MKIIAHIKPTEKGLFKGTTEEQIYTIRDRQKFVTVRTAGKGLAIYFWCALCTTNGCEHTDFVKKFLNKA